MGVTACTGNIRTSCRRLRYKARWSRREHVSVYVRLVCSEVRRLPVGGPGWWCHWLCPQGRWPEKDWREQSQHGWFCWDCCLKTIFEKKKSDIIYREILYFYFRPLCRWANFRQGETISSLFCFKDDYLIIMESGGYAQWYSDIENLQIHLI